MYFYYHNIIPKMWEVYGFLTIHEREYIKQNIRNMKKLIVLFMCIFSLGMSAQSQFKEGYVLLMNGDTLYGQIENRNYYNNSIQCLFKPENSNTAIKYTPDQLLGYRFTDGKYYISKQVDTEGTKKTLFLEYLINGELNVYFYQDNNGNHYYVNKSSSSLRELTYSKDIITIDGLDYLRDSKPFINVLDNLTGDCQSVKDDIKKLDVPDHRNLIKIAEEYHNQVCKDRKCIIYEKKMPRKLKLEFVGGSSTVFAYADNIIQKSYPSYGFNIFMQQPIASERIYLGAGLIFDGKIDSSKTYYRVPLSINYCNFEQKLSPFLSFGIDIPYVVQTYQAGLTYNLKKCSFLIITDLKMALIRPIGSSQRIGIIFYLN